jgi:hypothetical protein
VDRVEESRHAGKVRTFHSEIIRDLISCIPPTILAKNKRKEAYEKSTWVKEIKVHLILSPKKASRSIKMQDRLRKKTNRYVH